MHNIISKKLLAGALSVMMVLSLVAPSNSQAASKYTLTNKTSVKAGVTYKYQLKGVKTSQYVKVTRNVSGETVKYNKKSVTKNTKIKGTGKTLKLFVNYGEKAKNYTGKVTVKIYNKKTNKVVKTIVEKATVKCSEDVAGNITISDVSGLQSNGTGLVKDTITLSYGDEVGTPASITWYRDNAILATFTDKAMSYSANNGLALSNGTAPANYTAKVGKYWAVVKTTAGKTIKSNTIELTDVEAPAVIKSFAIEDDYETGVTKSTGATKLDYNKTDKQAIATLVVNRDYAADLSIYAESNKTFTGSSVSTTKDTALTTATGFTVETSNKKMTNEDVSTATTTTAKKYVADNGEVTYRWVVNGTGLTRGTSYVAVYDQDSIKEDTIGDGKENVSKAATAPYLTAPAKIAVTKASAGSAPEISLYDEAGNVLAWLGNTTSVSTIFTGLNVYENKSKSTTAAHSAGVTNASPALKGVITGNHALTAAGTYSWYYATATTTKGIFADKAVTLTSDFVSGAENAADSVALAQNSTTATTAEVTFTNAKTDGIVYILTAAKYAAITKDSEVATNAQAHANVTKGDAKVLVEGALDAVGDYYAVFMPTDATAYNRTDSAKATISAEATTLKMDNANLFVDLTSNVLTIKGLVAYDQYGAKMSRAVGPYTASATVIDADG
nr:hypothetical protein [Clostridium sp.]